MNEVKVPPNWIKPKVKLVGEDGNAFAILGRCTKGMRKIGATQEQIEEFREQATSGDYSHLLVVAMTWVEDIGEDRKEE